MKLGYTILYVPDVPATVAFWEAAFSLHCRFIHDSGTYAEMETGATALAFASVDTAEMLNLAVHPNDPALPPAAWEVCLVTQNVKQAWDHALAKGATPVTPPAEKPCGQTVSYVRDLNGCLVEIASPIPA